MGRGSRVWSTTNVAKDNICTFVRRFVRNYHVVRATSTSGGHYSAVSRPDPLRTEISAAETGESQDLGHIHLASAFASLHLP